MGTAELGREADRWEVQIGWMMAVVSRVQLGNKVFRAV